MFIYQSTLRAPFVMRLAFAFLLIAPASDAQAITVRPMDLVELHRGSQTVFYGRCTTEYVEQGDGSLQVRVSEFEVLDSVKGGSDNTVRVRQFAGFQRAKAIRMKAPIVSFVPGREYLVFVPAPSRIGLASPVGFTQGAFRVWADDGAKRASNGRSLAKLLETFPLDAVSQPVRDRVFLLQENKSTAADLAPLLDLLRRLSDMPEQAR